MDGLNFSLSLSLRTSLCVDVLRPVENGCEAMAHVATGGNQRQRAAHCQLDVAIGGTGEVD